MKTPIAELFEKYGHLLPDVENEYLEKEKKAIEVNIQLSNDSNLSKEFIEWRDKYFDKNIKVLEWKSKKHGKRFTSLELYDNFNKAMLGETLHLKPKL